MKGRFSRMAGYGAGDIYGGGAFILSSLLYLNFLTDIEFILPVLAGIIVFVGKVWDAVTDPFMGWLSDRTKSRFGRRGVYFLFGSIPVAISFAMLWFSFGIPSMAGRFIYHLFANMFFSTAFTVVMVPYNSVLPEKESDYNERTLFTSFRMIFSMGASILCAVLPALIRDAVPASPQIQYLVMGLPFALLFGLCWLAVYASSRRAERTRAAAQGATAEQVYSPGSDATLTEAAESSQARPSIFASLSSTLRNRAFRLYLGMFLLGQGSVDIILALFVYYLTSYLGRPGEYSAILGVLLVFQLLGLPFYTPFARRYGKTFPMLIGIPLGIVAMLLAFFTGPQSHPLFVYLFAALGGFGFAVCTLVPFSILPDIPDVDELISGKRREGLYAGMATFSRKLVNGISVAVAALVLQFSGYIAAAETQSQTALWGIRLAFSLVPIGMLLGTFIISRLYHLGPTEHAALLSVLNARRGAAEQGLAGSTVSETLNPPMRRTLADIAGMKESEL